LLSVNILNNSISADFPFYCCVYSVLRQLSRIVPNNGDSHKGSMYQNVQTCILEVNNTRIGIKLPVDIVQGLHSHTQRARLQTCIAVKKEHKNTWKYTWGYIRGVYNNSGSSAL